MMREAEKYERYLALRKKYRIRIFNSQDDPAITACDVALQRSGPMTYRILRNSAELPIDDLTIICKYIR